MVMRASTQKYKDANSNYKIKVSSATVAKLKKGTKASNIAAANMAGATAEYKEAVRRFYGKGSIKSTTVNTPNQKENRPPRMPTPNDRENRKAGMTAPKPSGGPGAKPIKISPPKGGPGSKSRPSSGQTPNQREGRKVMSPKIKPGGGPGAKMPKAPRGGPGARGRKG